MANLTSQLIVKLIDGVSGPAKSAAAAIRSLNGVANGRSGGGFVAMQDRVNQAIEKNNRAIAGLQNRLVTAGAGAYALHRSIANVVAPAVSFESALADVAKVSDFDDAGLETFGKKLRKLASTEIPMAVNELAALAANAAQSGVADADLFDFTKLTAKAAVAWEMTGAAAGESLAKLRSALGLTNQQTALYADAINHLSDNTASSAGDLVDYARRVAAQGEFFGFAKEQSLAFGAAMVGSGAQADVAATSFRNMGRALTRGASATKAQRRAYKALGLDASKVAKQMQADATGTTLDVIERLGKLPEHVQASVMSDLFGDEARALAPLLGRLDILKDALKLVADEQAYANSVSGEFARRARTAEYRLQLFYNQVKDIGLALSGSLLPALKSLLDTVGPIALRVAEFAEANSKAIVGIGAVTAGLIGLKIAAIGAGIAGRFAFGGLLMLAKGALAIVKPLAWLTAGAFAPLIGTLRYLRRLSAFGGLVGKGGMFALLGSDIALLASRARGLFSLRNILRGLMAFGPKGWILAAGLTAAAGAAAVVAKNFDKFKSAGSGFWEGFTKNLKPVEGSLKPIADAAGKLWNSISSLVPELEGTNKSWKDWGATIGGTVANAINSVVDAINGLVGLLSTAVEKASQFGSAVRSWVTGRPRGTGGEPIGPGEGNPIPTGRSRGGRVSRGNSYIVGERRPELFTPGQSGYITPRMPEGGGGATINVSQTFHIDGSTDPAALIERIKKEMETGVREALRGVQADVRLGFGY